MVQPSGVVLSRGRILQALRGGRAEKVMPFSSIERVIEGGGGGITILPQNDSDLGPPRTLHGIAAVTVLAAWWTSMGRADARLMAAPATYVGALGIARRGAVLAGPAGLAFVPTGWTGAVDDTLVRIPQDRVQGVRRSGPGRYVVVGEFPGELRLDASLDHLAVLLSRSFDPGTATPRVGGIVTVPVVWQTDDQMAWRGVVSVASGRMSIAALGGGTETVDSPAHLVEQVRLVASGDCPELVCRLGGHLHTLRPLGPDGLLRRLDVVLQKARRTVARPRIDRERWEKFAGSHRVVRLFRGASEEGVLEAVQVKVSDSGIRLRGRPREGALSSARVDLGSRIRVTVPRGRGWHHFVGTVCNLVEEIGPGAVVESVDLLVLPVADGPSAESGRRSYHRVTFDEPVPVPVQRLGRTGRRDWFTAEMFDLSAGGVGARLSRPVSVGQRYRLTLPVGEECLSLEAEVAHCRMMDGCSDAWVVGFRLLGVTERLRSLLQREVLRQERVALVKRRRRVELRATGTDHRRAHGRRA